MVLTRSDHSRLGTPLTSPLRNPNKPQQHQSTGSTTNTPRGTPSASSSSSSSSSSAHRGRNSLSRTPRNNPSTPRGAGAESARGTVGGSGRRRGRPPKARLSEPSPSSTPTINSSSASSDCLRLTTPSQDLEVGFDLIDQLSQEYHHLPAASELSYDLTTPQSTPIQPAEGSIKANPTPNPNPSHDLTPKQLHSEEQQKQHQHQHQHQQVQHQQQQQQQQHHHHHHHQTISLNHQATSPHHHSNSRCNSPQHLPTKQTTPGETMAQVIPPTLTHPHLNTLDSIETSSQSSSIVPLDTLQPTPSEHQPNPHPDHPNTSQEDPNDSISPKNGPPFPPSSQDKSDLIHHSDASSDPDSGSDSDPSSDSDSDSDPTSDHGSGNASSDGQHIATGNDDDDDNDDELNHLLFIAKEKARLTEQINDEVASDGGSSITVGNNMRMMRFDDEDELNIRKVSKLSRPLKKSELIRSLTKLQRPLPIPPRLSTVLETNHPTSRSYEAPNRLRIDRVGPPDNFDRVSIVKDRQLGLQPMHDSRNKPSKALDWADLPVQEITKEVKMEIQGMRLHQTLDPKRFFKGGIERAVKEPIPNKFLFGHIIDPTSSSLFNPSSSSIKKRSFVDSLLEDQEAQGWSKKQYMDQVQIPNRHHNRFKNGKHHTKRNKK